MEIVSKREVTSPDELSRDFLVGNGMSVVKSKNAWRAYGFPDGYNMEPCVGNEPPPYNKWVALTLFMEGLNEGFFMIGGAVEDDEKYWPFIEKYLRNDVLIRLGYSVDDKDKCFHDIKEYMELINTNGGYEAPRISFKENFPDAGNDLIMKAHVGMLIQDWVVRTHIGESMDTYYGVDDEIHDEYFKRGCDKIMSFLDNSFNEVK